MSNLSNITDSFLAQVSHQLQPANNELNSRLERLQELERARLERVSHLNTTAAGDSSQRLSRRDQLIRQATQQRMPDRRNIAAMVQRTPVRSQSFEIQSSAVQEDMSSFRDMFEHSRQSAFGSRNTGSNESLTLGSRRQSDTPMSGIRSTTFGSDSGSGSSTPRSAIREQFGMESLAGAFAEVTASLFGSNSNIHREVRSSSITREARDTSSPTPRFSISPSASTLTRSSSLREGRDRFRRRTIQGVDNQVREALERERRSPLSYNAHNSSERLTQPSSTFSTRTERLGIQPVPSLTEGLEVNVTEPSSTIENGHYTFRSSINGKVNLFPEDGVPVLGFLEDRFCFIDEVGKVRWLDKTHRIIRTFRSSNRLPEITIKSALESTRADEEGLVESMEGDAEFRHQTLREMLSTSSKRNKFNRSNSNSSEDESTRICGIYDIEPKIISFYTLPRPRPNLEEYCKSKKFKPLYDDLEVDNDEESLTTSQVETGHSSYSVNLADTRTSVSYVDGAANVSSSRNDGVNRALVRESEQNLMIHEPMMSPIAESPGLTDRHFSASSDTPVQTEKTEEVEEVPGEINLVLQRIGIMTGDDVQDPVNLDYEEMMMIQKVLQENPSPPDSPTQLMSPALQTVTPFPNDHLSSQQMNSSSQPGMSQPSMASHSENNSSENNSSKNKSSREVPKNVISPNSVSASSVSTVTASSSSSSNLVTRSDSKDSTETSAASPSPPVSLKSPSASSSAMEPKTAPLPINAVYATRMSVITSKISPNSPGSASPKTSTSPKVSRSSTSADTRLPLPTLDFSPIQTSSQKDIFTFPDTQNNTKAVAKPVQSKEPVKSNSSSGAGGVSVPMADKASTLSPISIEIPGERSRLSTSGASGHLEPQAGSSGRLSTGSDVSHASPAGSDTVTTVFEEFVSTIPREMINNWSPTNPKSFSGK